MDARVLADMIAKLVTIGTIGIRENNIGTEWDTIFWEVLHHAEMALTQGNDIQVATSSAFTFAKAL